MLINKNYGQNFKEHLLEQYKLYVKSVEEISSKRSLANNFYLVLNSILFTLFGYSFFTERQVFNILPLIGIIISFNWIRTIYSYRHINSAKFSIIHELENYLPAALFREEEPLLKWSLTNIEVAIPIIFLILYIGVMTI